MRMALLMTGLLVFAGCSHHEGDDMETVSMPVVPPKLTHRERLKKEMLSDLNAAFSKTGDSTGSYRTEELSSEERMYKKVIPAWLFR